MKSWYEKCLGLKINEEKGKSLQNVQEASPASPVHTAGVAVVFFVPGEAAAFSSPAVSAVGFDKPTTDCRFEEAVLRGRQNSGFYCWRTCLSGLGAGGKGFGQE